MPRRPKEATAVAVRNPDRTRKRILDAAFKEFSLRGLAGSRVDVIARRAKINKRMLYHYFGDKQGLYRALLHRKIDERRNSVEARAPKADMVSSIKVWFQQNCQDADWVRLLAWESLQTTNDRIQSEEERRRLARRVTARIKRKQATGLLRNDVTAVHLQLARVSLAMFPMAMPQLARIVLGYSPHSAKFQREYARFLETISVIFRPPAVAGK